MAAPLTAADGLAHAGEDHRRERSEPAVEPAAGEVTTDAPTTPATLSAPAAAEPGGLQLVLGLAVLSGWLWLPLLRQLKPGRLRRQREK